MSQQLMRNTQGARQELDAAWSLAAGEVVRLRVGPGPRQLRVVEGWLWLTTEGTATRMAEDVWLLPGEPMELAEGSEWVVEARSTGRFQLLVPRQPSPWRAWQAHLAWWFRGFRPAPPRGLRA